MSKILIVDDSLTMRKILMGDILQLGVDTGGLEGVLSVEVWLD